MNNISYKGFEEIDFWTIYKKCFNNLFFIYLCVFYFVILFCFILSMLFLVCYLFQINNRMLLLVSYLVLLFPFLNFITMYNSSKSYAIMGTKLCYLLIEFYA